MYAKLHNHTKVGKLIILHKTALHNEKHTQNRYFVSILNGVYSQSVLYTSSYRINV